MRGWRPLLVAWCVLGGIRPFRRDQSRHSKSAALTVGLLAAIGLGLLLAVPADAAVDGIGYVFDPAGRLSAVVDPADPGGLGVATYAYDAAGNIAGIGRQSAATVTILGFTPARAAVGAQVTVSGAGFSATAANDTVKFGGVTATIVSATRTQLVATVPSGAVAGTIQVLVASVGSATSSGSFTVGTPSAPTVSGFGGSSVLAAGSALTISGTNFRTTSAFDKVGVNLLRATVTAATSTSITTTVPPGATSGKVWVTTPDGAAVSTGDLVVPPGTHTVSDVVATGRATVGTAFPFTIGTAGTGKVGVVMFEGNQGQRVSLSWSGSTLGTTSYQVYDPSGFQIRSSSLVGASGYVDTLRLPYQGTYVLALSPTTAGSTTLTFADVADDSTGTISVGASAQTITTTTAGQNATRRFTATAGHRIAVQVSSSTFGSGCCGGQVGIQDTDTAPILAPAFFATGSTFVDPTVMPATKTYVLTVDPQTNASGSAAFQLIDVPADPTYSITPGGSAQTATTSTAGQNATLTFSGTAGQKVSLAISSVSYGTSAATGTFINMKKPDGTNLTSPLSVGTAGAFIDTVTLPTTGTYTILLDPVGNLTGSATFTLYDVPADVTGSIVSGGSAGTFTIPTPGQNGAITFSGISGKHPTLTISSITIGTSACCGVKVSIKNPDGSQLVAPTFFGTAGGTLSPTLAQTGTFTIVVDPQAGNTGNITLQISGAAAAFRAVPRRLTSTSPAPAPALLTAPTTTAAAAASTTRSSLASAPGSVTPTDGWSPEQEQSALRDLRGWPGASGAAAVASPWRLLPAYVATDASNAISGQVLSLSGLPINGVTLRIADQAVTTDATGRFLLSDITAGHQVLAIDGTTAGRYGTFEYGAQVRSGTTTVLPFTIWLGPLSKSGIKTVPTVVRHRTVLRAQGLPGFEVILPRGARVTDDNGQPVHRIGATRVPIDQPPFPMPSFPGGGQPIAYFTVQPGPAYVAGGATVIYPNPKHLAPGTRVPFYNYDPDASRGWYVYGYGEVSANGTQIVPERDVRIWSFAGAMTIGNGGGGAPPPGGPDGGGGSGGDPVNTGTGYFDTSKTDLYEPDVIPISVTRTYRSADTAKRSFSVGMASNYDMFLWSVDGTGVADLSLPSGSLVHYTLISGSDQNLASSIYKAAAQTGPFQNSRIANNGAGWDLTLRDGTTYVFGTNKPLQAIRDRAGNQVTIRRDTSNKITQVISPNGRWITYSYDSSSRVTGVTDQSGRSYTYTYNAGTSGTIATASTTDNGTTLTTTYTSDSSKRITQIQDARGIIYVTNFYDSNNRVTSQTLGDGGGWGFSYTLSGSKVTQTDVTDPNGNVERSQFNSDGYLTSDTRAYGTALAQTTTITRQSGTDLPTSVTDQLGRTTAYTYDEFGNVASITTESGTSSAETTNLTYDPNFNQLASITDPLSHTTTLGYDAHGRQTTVTNSLNKTWTIAYGTSGRVSSTTTPKSEITAYSYDHGDLTAVTDPLSRTSTAYTDSGGRILLGTDATGATTQNAFDDSNDLTSTTDPNGSQTAFTYDANGNVASVTDPRGHASGFTYDPLNRVETETDPLTHIATIDYDPAGNLASITDRRGELTTITRDALNRPTQVGYGTVLGTPNTYDSTIGFTYDAANRVTQLADSVDGTTTRTYDGRDDVLTEASPRGTITYTYDAAGRRATATVTGQTQVSYGYDNANHLTSVAQGTTAASTAYDDDGLPSLRTLPDSVTEAPTFDAAGELTAIAYAHGSTLGDLLYAYDSQGRRTSTGGSYARTGLPAAVSTTSYDNANELTTWGSASLAYDNNGNLTGDGSNTYAWDTRNRLSGISGAASATYTYDPLGRRASRTIGGTTTKYLYDGLNPIQEQDGSGTAIAETLAGLGLDDYLQRADSAGARSILTDALGSTIALGDPSGTLTTSYTYEPYGTPTATGATATNPFQFTGREFDPGTGLQYSRLRYYSPTYARFTAEDPAGLTAGTSNRYAYVYSNPTLAADPLGACPWCVEVGVSAGLGAIYGGIEAYTQGESVWKGALGGAVVGGAAGLGGSFGVSLFGGSAGGGALFGGALGAGSSYAWQRQTAGPEHVNLGSVVAAGLGGGLEGALGGFADRVFGGEGFGGLGNGLGQWGSTGTTIGGSPLGGGIDFVGCVLGGGCRGPKDE